jgi:4'-phosphopantetheinyl transferase
MDLGDSDNDDVSGLSSEEAARAASFRFERDRRRFVASRRWLRRLLADRLGVRPEAISYAVDAHGKPWLADQLGSSLAFSLSRSGDVAVVALAARRDVGVDVEAHRTDDQAVVERRVFSPPEQSVLGRLEGVERREGFFRLWARKEAFVKAVGVGLTMPLDAIDVTGEMIGLLRPLPEFPAAAGSWSVRDLELEPGYAAAVVIEGLLPPDMIRLRRVSSY